MNGAQSLLQSEREQLEPSCPGAFSLTEREEKFMSVSSSPDVLGLQLLSALTPDWTIWRVRIIVPQQHPQGYRIPMSTL